MEKFETVKFLKKTDKKKFLITGAAGFIGYSLIKKLIEKNVSIIGIDNINDYYDINLKKDRLKNLGIELSENQDPIKSAFYGNFSFKTLDVKDMQGLYAFMEKNNFTYVIHLAAQAGVRYSIEAPESYITNNIIGFWNIIEASRKLNVEHFVYASSSSIYGGLDKTPYDVSQKTDTPLSLYAATKKSNELIAHSYSNIYNLKTTGLRFFTVYGPWGRPDMAYYSFTKSIIENKEISVFNNGNLKRDFTYIDDIVEGLEKVISRSDEQKYKVYNIGNNEPVELLKFINTLEIILNKKAKIKFLEHQKGDVYETYAAIDPMINEFDFKPQTSIQEGLNKFVDWYKRYYRIK